MHKTLSDLRSDESIKVCSFDKGNGVVILNSSDYYKKLDAIISDKSKFEVIAENDSNDHPIIRNEESIQRYLKNYLKDDLT